MSGDRWVLPSEAGRIIGLSPNRVRQLVDARELPAEIGPGGIRLISRNAAEDFAKKRRRTYERALVAAGVAT